MKNKFKFKFKERKKKVIQNFGYTQPIIRKEKKRKNHYKYYKKQGIPRNKEESEAFV